MKRIRFDVVKRTVLQLILVIIVACLGMAAAVPQPAVADASSAFVNLTNPLAGQESRYSITFQVGPTGALTAVSDEIMITFPSDTDLPSTMNYTNVFVGSSETPAVNVGSGGITVNGQTAIVRCPIDVADSETVTVTFAQGLGIVNPTLSKEPSVGGGDGQGSDGYQIAVSTSQETTPVYSEPYYIYNWIDGDFIGADAGDPITVTGGGFLADSLLTLTGNVSGSGTVASDGTVNILGSATGVNVGIIATDESGRTAWKGFLPPDGTLIQAVVVLSNRLANQLSLYTIGFQVGPVGGLTGGYDEIMITFPPDTDLPSSMNYTNVLVGSSEIPPVNVGSGGITISGQTAIVRCPIDVADSGIVDVTFTQSAGIVNPTLSKEPSVVGDGQGADGYQVAVSTTQETNPLYTEPYYVYNWIEAEPMAAAMGDPVTVTGGGFMAGLSVTLSGGASGGGTVGADGTFSIEALATGVPGFSITATDGSGRTASTVPMTVLPGLSVSPTSGNIGSVISLTGKDFSGTTTPSVTVGGVAAPFIGSFEWSDQDSDGNSDDFAASVNIPIGLAGGPKVVQVMDNGGVGSPTATANIEVAPHQISIEPVSGISGSTIIVTGAGWPPSAVAGGILLWSYGGGLVVPIGDMSLETDGTGAFTEVAAIPTNAPAGTSAIVCSFGASTAMAYFTVTERELTVDPQSGPRGTDVTVSGGQLTGGGLPYTATVMIGGAFWGGPITLDSQGNLTPTTLKISPTVPEGIHQIVATDNSSIALTASGLFEVTKPTLRIEPTSAHPGALVTAIGEGWIPGLWGVTTVQWNNTSIAIAEPDADGNFSVQFNIPENANAAIYMAIPPATVLATHLYPTPLGFQSLHRG